MVPVQLDKMRNFKYGMRANDRIEKMLNTKMTKLNLEEMSTYEIAVIIWAGLVHEDKELTPESVMDLIDEHSSMPDVITVMTKAITEAFGSGEQPGNTVNTPAAN